MKKFSFKEVEDSELLLYKYIRGSHLYGLNLPNGASDIDTGGVYYEPIEHVIGLGLDYSDEISDDKHDNVIYELQKFFNLLRTSNPTMLESLFVDDEHVIFEHPVMEEIRKHRNSFLSKELYKPFVGYAESQIKKATGLHKLCVNPVTERKEPLDFCFTPYKQGSACMRNWLAARGLEQKFCGLVSLNNMPDCYGVYYDFGAHNKAKYKNYEDFLNDEKYFAFCSGIECLEDWFNNTKTPIGYRGIVKGDGTADDVRCSSIPKGEEPICVMTYNKDGFTQHCNKYHQYQEWVQKRNKVRYEENKEKTWDGKNIMHCLRLLTMAQEIFEGKGVCLNRKLAGDAEFFLKVRNHEFEYQYISELLEKKLQDVNKVYENTNLPDKIDTNFINELLLNTRKKLYNLN